MSSKAVRIRLLDRFKSGSGMGTKNIVIDYILAMRKPEKETKPIP
jgi:hypothetical protein